MGCYELHLIDVFCRLVVCLYGKKTGSVISIYPLSCLLKPLQSKNLYAVLIRPVSGDL